MLEAVAVTLEYAGGVGADAGGGGEGATADEEATLDPGGGAGVGTCSVDPDERCATVITAATNAPSTTMPDAPRATDVHRRCGVKSGTSPVDSGTDADHGASASSGIRVSGKAPTYNGRVVAVAGVSASRVAGMGEMVYDLRGDSGSC